MTLSPENFDAEQLALFAPVLAILISNGLSSDQMNIMAAFFNSVSDLLELLAIKQEAIETQEGSSSKNENKSNSLK